MIDQKSISIHTYADLRIAHETKLKSEGVSTQQIRNQLSSLSFFMQCHSRNECDDISKDFNALFNDLLYAYDKWLLSKKYSKSTIKGRVSTIRIVKETALELASLVDTSNTFAETLKSLMDKHNLNCCSLSKKLKNKCYSTLLYTWISSTSTPHKKNLHIVQELETFFKLPNKTLVNMLSGKNSIDYAKSDLTLKQRTDLRKLTRDTYSLKDFSNSIKEEWKEYLLHKTAPFLLDDMKRNSSWRVKKAENVNKYYHSWYSTTPYGVCVTALGNWGLVSRFLSWLSYNGYEEEQLTLGLLSDAKLVMRYIEFLRERRGMYTNSHVSFLRMAMTLLRPTTGYIWQKTEFSSKIGKNMSTEDWHIFCEKNREFLRNILKDLKASGHIKKGRDPFLPIASIIDLQHPITALFDMVERMERFIPSTSQAVMNAVTYRNILLVKMLICNPLRIGQYSIMTWTEENDGNLYKNTNGKWCLRFNPSDFKNERSAAKKEYNIILSEWLYEDIEKYVTIYRKDLNRTSLSNKLFLPAWGHATTDGEHMQANHLSSLMVDLTKKYIPNCCGFGPHAFRHIIATEYIKNNPNGFQVVANILHDKLETVLQNYAHLKVADGFSFWTSYLDNQRREYQNAEGSRHV